MVFLGNFLSFKIKKEGIKPSFLIIKNIGNYFLSHHNLTLFLSCPPNSADDTAA